MSNGTKSYQCIIHWRRTFSGCFNILYTKKTNMNYENTADFKLLKYGWLQAKRLNNIVEQVGSWKF